MFATAAGNGRCPKCDGEGELIVRVYSKSGRFSHYGPDVMCGYCKGAGRVANTAARAAGNVPQGQPEG